jgi:DNA-directed RNA polymerase subunit RPC12/RpoP
MGEYACLNCNLEFDIDIISVEYNLYKVNYCPNCGTPIDGDIEYE